MAKRLARSLDMNICCKCGHDLTAVAEPPPAKCAPHVVCPECGNAVALRETWWHDGWYSMARLMVFSVIWSMGAMVCVFLNFGAPSLRGWMLIGGRLGVLVALVACLPMFSLIVVGPLLMGHLGPKGSAIFRHGQQRGYAACAPFWVVMILYFIFGEAIYRAMAG